MSNSIGTFEVVNTSGERVSAGGITWGPYEKRDIARLTADIKTEIENETRLQIIYPADIESDATVFNSAINSLAVPNQPNAENTQVFKSNGLNIPEPEDDPEYTESEPVNDNFLKENNTLMVGSGNPSTDLLQIANDQIALCLGVRRAFDTNTVAPDGGDFEIELTKDQDWIIVFMVSGLNIIPTKYYDIQLTFFGDSEGSTDSDKGFISFKLQGDTTGYTWVSNSFGKNITDSYISDDGKTVGNISRYTYYPEIISPEVETPPPFEGTFVIHLEAKHKTTGESLLLEARAIITLVE